MHLYIKERHLTVAIVDIVKLLEAKKVKSARVDQK